MKILSQNVNGIRARIKQGFENTINELKPDIPLYFLSLKSKFDDLACVLTVILEKGR